MTDEEPVANDTDSTITSESDQTCSQIRDRGLSMPERFVINNAEEILKRKIEVLEKENQLLRDSNTNPKKRRKPKKTSKGSFFVPLRLIPKEDRLNEDQMYMARKMIRKSLFRQMKYFMETYKQDTLTLAWTAVGKALKDEDKVKYSDYIVYYIDKQITAQRNNAIHGLKKVVMGISEEGGPLSIPEGYKSWSEAMESIITERAANKNPNDADAAKVWNAFETVAVKLVPRVSVHYKDNSDRCKNVYHKTVTTSDEAFIWQILTCYEEYWSGADKDGNDSLDNSSNGKRGQKPGFIKTASKTLETFGKYCTLVGESRKAPNTKLWSEKLMKMAKKKSNKQELKDDTLEPMAAPPVATIAMEEHLQMYTRLNLCELSCDLSGDEVFAEDPGDEDDSTADIEKEEV